MTRDECSASLLSLPEDVLLTLPHYLRDIEDFINLAATCRLLHNLSLHTLPRTILRLAAAASRTFFRPDPCFLVAATARQVGEWASRSSENTAELRAAFRKGMDGLLELALEHAGLTMERIRELYELRFSTINPVVDLIDRCVGVQWYATPNFWDGGVDDAWTLNMDPPETFFHLATYGELFAPAFDTFLDTGVVPEAMDVDTRLEFVKYCIPDWMCYIRQKDLRNTGNKPDPRRVVQPVGPYEPFLNSVKTYPDGFTEYTHQRGLGHLIDSTRWNPSWAEVRAAVGGDFEEEWRQDLWKAVVMYQGLEGMKMIRPGDLAPWRERLAVWRAKIAALTLRPRKVRVGRQETCVFPDLRGDVDIASGSL
ncbi:uncharacterized protein C8Q71DRAFT_556026 [Rhodofomes roseus]|uniref:F-box domain-containing protein n=1 Tax=Rhodofomes roseus TaxID=34475 RepID=A0ABQ8KI45_9APHY|nr:uncharacterized protein C8Q71DRAFT_556026 [Rhodofomes roseus]KAH9837676.1 hypothetical protein C8Q71DRAFT_556026 [Rhodofomes roseus]